MRIAIDARYVADHFPGIGRYIYNLLRGLAEIEHPHTLLVLHNPALPNTRHDLLALARFPNVELVATAARPFSPREQIAVPRLLRRLGADVFHAPYYVRPYLGLSCPVAVTLYDAIPRLFPSETSWRARLLFDALTRLAVRDARRIFAISASARDDLVAAYRLAPERVIVTPLAADARFGPQPPERIAVVRAQYGLPEQYVLSVCSNKPHKNLARLIEAFDRLQENRRTREPENPTTENQEPRTKNQSVPSVPQFHSSLAARSPAHPLTRSPVHLVIAGHWDVRYPEAQELVEQRGLSARVRFLPNVAEADLPALIGGATLFVFPSLYEGFGLPPLEALACGVPVLCSNASSLPEVVGDAALLVDPRDVAALAAGMAALLDDAALRARLRTTGLARAAQFSWQRTAAATLRGLEDAARPQG